MRLKDHIDDISNLLKQGAFVNERERTVSHRIVNRLLQALEWPIFTPQIVIDEYAVEGRRVDFALCHPESIPRAFIEAKRVGNIDKGIKQLFEYAFHRGIPIVVLTDGQKWRFYHPAGEGSYEDRKVVELDLIADDSEDCSNYFDRYLNYESVKIGRAAKIIATDYQRIVSLRKVEERLPEIWGELLLEKNQSVLHAMIEKTKDKVGHEPTEEQVLTFLKDLTVPPVQQKPHIKKESKILKQSKKKLSPSKRLQVTMQDGVVIDHDVAKDTFVEVIEKMGLEEVMQIRPKIVSMEPFYPNREDREDWSVQRGEFHIKTHSSTSYKESFLKSVAEKLGVELNVELVEKT